MVGCRDVMPESAAAIWVSDTESTREVYHKRRQNGGGPKKMSKVQIQDFCMRCLNAGLSLIIIKEESPCRTE